MVSKQAEEARRQQREFEAGRRQLGRALAKATRIVTKGSGWRTCDSVLFRVVDGWFVGARAVPWIVKARTVAALRTKPMELDPLFWKVIRCDDLIEQPPSFRALGAFVCSTPELREADIPEGNSQPEYLARGLLDWANEQLLALKGTLSIAGFVDFLRTYARQVHSDHYLATLITGLLLQGKDDEALALCQDARCKGHSGGFGIGTKTFIDLAIEWIEKKPPSAAQPSS